MKAEIEPGNADSEKNISQTSQSTPLDSLVLPPHLKTIWMNANSIFVDSTAIVQAPGDSTAYIVKSLSGQKPHYVRPSKGGGGFLCDDECLGYKSAKICAHTVSAALKADDIEAYVSGADLGLLQWWGCSSNACEFFLGHAHLIKTTPVFN